MESGAYKHPAEVHWGNPARAAGLRVLASAESSLYGFQVNNTQPQINGITYLEAERAWESLETVMLF